MLEGYLTVLVSTQITISMFRVHHFNKKCTKTDENSKDSLRLPSLFQMGTVPRLPGFTWKWKGLKTLPFSFPCKQVALFSVRTVKQRTCESPFQMKLARPPMNISNASYGQLHLWKCKEMLPSLLTTLSCKCDQCCISPALLILKSPGRLAWRDWSWRPSTVQTVSQVIQAYNSVSDHRIYILCVSCCLRSWHGIWIVSTNAVWPYKVFGGLCALLAKLGVFFTLGNKKMKPGAQSLLQCIPIQ